MKSKYHKIIAAFVAINILAEATVPSLAFALTGGPSQPEVQSFEPIGTSDMVDLFTGDFNYNIPLMDVGGYPINISYNSGVTMDQEASWVGLGWNLNVGTMNRNMRGIPDDFQGDEIITELNQKDNNTYGVAVSAASGEFFGIEDWTGNLTFGLGINYNNYNGVGIELSANASVSAGDEAKGHLTGDLGISSSSSGGLEIKPAIGFSDKIAANSKEDLGIKVGTAFNSREGLKVINIVAGQYLHYGDKVGNYQGIGSSITMGGNTYIPSISMPMKNTSVTGSFKTGGHIFGADATINLTGYYSQQRLAKNIDNTPAYGYLYLEKGANKDRATLDYNRTNDAGFTMNTPALPITNLTYDMYSATGQGVGGSYRAFRSEIGTVSDPLTTTTSGSFSMGAELGGGALFKVGADFGYTDVYSESGKWKEHNPVADQLKFKDNPNDPLYEPFYFKQQGEMSVDEEYDIFENFGSSDATRISLENDGGLEVRTTPIPDGNARSERVKRNQVMTFLTKGDLPAFGLDAHTNLYGAPAHHIGEVSILRNDGARYVYGIAAYNTLQEETTFSLGLTRDRLANTVDCETGLVGYQAGIDNSKNNIRGKDNYYSNTITPAYAHSYLLTAVLSSDYIDNDGVRGPSEGDLGTYTKFNYTKHDANYKWRVPYEENKANANRGLNSDESDNKANYIYGEKELWYLESIETKNFTAIFVTLNDRKDAHGVIDRNGGLDINETSKKLSEIILYSKKDYDLYGSSAIPIKTVHFVHDYSLCPDVPNNDGTGSETGKLTLTSIYFTYGTSEKAGLNKYDFVYSDFNPSYNLKAYDRWGNYKPNTSDDDCDNNSNVTPWEFPYVEQDKTNADQYSSAWTLTEISLPSGGKISIDYESDDYAYVQNKRANQMFKITSLGDGPEGGDDDPDGGLRELNPQNIYMYFELQDEVPTASSEADTDLKIANFKKNYLDELGQYIYFRAATDITKYDDYEFVSGYFEIDQSKSGMCDVNGNTGFDENEDFIGGFTGNYTHGFIKLKTVNMGEPGKTGFGIDAHPIARAAWQFGRMNMPNFVWNQPDVNNTGIENVWRTLASSTFFRDIYQTFTGPNFALSSKGFGKKIELAKSWIRLQNPNMKKLGGGCRVKSIEISDEWEDMVSGELSNSYGQDYTYTMMENGKEISSGVAAYEPQLGGDENPFKQPIFFGDAEKNLLAPNDKYYLEAPLGEEFFPSASVGYRQVTVKNKSHQKVTHNATGSIVHEFYTAYDFPTIVDRTDLDARPKKTNPIVKLLKFNNKDYMNVSQGFSVEVNDMHGKPKKQIVYAEGDPTPLSTVEYKYKSTPYLGNSFRLDNKATIVKSDGTTAIANIGVDYDIVSDMRQQLTRVVSIGMKGNLANFLAAIFPITAPSYFPQFSQERTRFRSTVMVKVVQRYGLLEQTIATDLGSKVSTKNMAYDAETGEVLVTETQNDFNDPVYSFTYPAHWYYDQMGSAYKNINATLKNVTFSSSIATVANANKYFVEGDVLGAEIVSGNSSNKFKLWVSDVTENTVTVMNILGNNYSGTISELKVLVSGRKNLQSTPIGSILSLSNPLEGLGNNSFRNIIQANVVEFTDEWKTFCECYDANNSNVLMQTHNPYLKGQSGIWKTKKSLTYLSNRKLTRENNNTDIRTDGIFTSFNPFWKIARVSSKATWVQDYNNWTWTTEVTEFSPYGGQEIENVDALGRYSAATYGYYNSLPTSVAANSRYAEIAFDNFEDYNDYTPCANDHFSYRASSNLLSTETAHTGKYSLKLPSSTNTSVLKDIDACTPVGEGDGGEGLLGGDEGVGEGLKEGDGEEELLGGDEGVGEGE